MESLIKYAEKAFEIPQIATFAMLFFLVSVKFAKKYFDDRAFDASSKNRYIVEELKNIDLKNSYLVEQAFNERYGYIINYKEIKFFLSTECPSFNLFLYLKSHSYFYFVKKGTGIRLASNYSDNGLRLRGLFYGAGYYFWAVMGLLLLQATPKLIEQSSSLVTALFFSFGFLFFAIMSAAAQLKTTNARRLKLSIKGEGL